MTRKALGRGLGALIPEVPTSREKEGGVEIDIDLIDPNPHQPRTYNNRGNLEGLVSSIRYNGIVQPILVRRRGSRYQLIAGERRWLAAQQAGLLKIPAILRDVPDDRLLEMALVENIQRQELTAIEEAHAYQRLIQELELTQEEAARRVGKDRATVANTLRLLKLPNPIKEWVHEGKLSMGHARALLALESDNQQLHLAHQIMKQDLSVRAVELKVKRLAASRGRGHKKNRNEDPNMAAALNRLRQSLGTKVEIVGSVKRGKIVVHYYSHEDLDRLFETLTGKLPQGLAGRSS